MLIYLPHILEEPYPYVRHKQEQFSPETLLANLDAFRVQLGSTDELQYVRDLANEYEPHLEAISSACWIDSLVCADIQPAAATRIDDYQSLIQQLPRDIGNAVLLSDTHTSTGPTLRECKRANPNTRYSVLCVDAHADIYATSEPLWKGNVFSRLIEEEVISRLLVLGVPQFRIDNVLSDTPAHIRERVGFADYRVRSNVQHMLEWLTEDADEVFVSIDPDGLNTREAVYTAMEYCPFQVLLNIGTLTEDYMDYRSASEAFGLALRPPGHPTTDGANTRKNLYRIGESGLTVEDTRWVVSEARSIMLSRGKQLGISRGSGILVGDIVELYGIDLYGHTASAVRAISNALIHQ